MISAVFLLTVFYFNPGISYSQNTDEKPEKLDENIPIHIQSDKMIAQRDAAYTEFIGNVVATRLDVIIKADSIKIFILDDKEKEGTKNNLKKIVATGNVEYTSKNRKAFADMAVYTAKDEILVLTGDAPKVKLGTSYVTGKKITFYQQKDQVVVESDKTRRVEAQYNPEDKNLTE